MKIKLILLFGIMFWTQYSQAQRALAIGGKVGINFSKYGNATIPGQSDLYITDFSPGFQAGAVGTMELSPKLKIQAELEYNQKGARDIYTDSTQFKSTNSVIERFMQLNALARYSRPWKKFNMNVFALAGPYVALGISKVVKEGNYPLPSQSHYGISDQSFDAGAQLGAGIGFPMGNGSMNFDARGSYGFLSTNTNYSQNRIQIMLGFHYLVDIR